MSLQFELWSVCCIKSKGKWRFDSLWKHFKKRNKTIPSETRKTNNPDRSPVCAELRTSKRTGVLSWTTLGWVDAAASADKHRCRTAWWEHISEASLLLSWSMGSEQKTEKGLRVLFMTGWSANLMLNCVIEEKNFMGRRWIDCVLKSETVWGELKQYFCWSALLLKNKDPLGDLVISV